MGRPGITYHDVVNLAQQLQGQGKIPTIEEIRRLFGSGSSSTIAPHLKKWKSQQSEAYNIATKENIPQELVSLIKGLWERIISQSEEKIAGIQQSSQEEHIQLQQELQKLKDANTHWQKQYHHLTQDKEQLANSKLGTEQAFAVIEKENDSLKTKQEALFQQLHEKQERIDELNRLHQQSQANLEHYRESAREQRLLDQQRSDQQQRQVEKTIDQLQQKLTHVNNENASLQQQCNQIRLEKESFQKINENHINQIEKIQTQLFQTVKERDENLQALNHSKNQCKIFQKNSDEQSKVSIDYQKQNAVLSQQLSSANKEIKNLTDQNKSLAHEKWVVVKEKSQLEGQLNQIEKRLKNHEASRI